MEKKPPRKRGPKPLINGETLKRKQVTIDEMTERMLKVLGKGNLSAGVRAAASVAYADYQRQKD